MAWLRRHANGVLAAAYGLIAAVVLSARPDRSFDYDESVSVASVISRGSANYALTGATTFNNHPLFSVGQSVWWDVAGGGEARQRVLPILYATAAVVVLVWWMSKRFGPLAAACAGAVLVVNPMFVDQARLVRGYSLVVLGVVVALVTMMEYVAREQREARAGAAWLLAIHAIAIVVALGTHLFAVVPLAAIGVGSLIMIGRFDFRVWVTWLAAAIGTYFVYRPNLDVLRESVDVPGDHFQPWFARAAAWEVLGRDRLTGVVIAAVALVGVAALASRRITTRPRVAAAAVVVPVLVVLQVWFIWQVVEPLYLYPRFFLAVVPLVAAAVAAGVKRQPWLALVVLIGLLFTLGNMLEARRRVVPIRELAAVVRTVDSLGLRTCAAGSWPLSAYGAFAEAVDHNATDLAGELRDCDVFMRIGTFGQPLVEPARQQFTYETRVGTLPVFSNVPPGELGLS